VRIGLKVSGLEHPPHLHLLPPVVGEEHAAIHLRVHYLTLPGHIRLRRPLLVELLFDGLAVVARHAVDRAVTHPHPRQALQQFAGLLIHFQLPHVHDPLGQQGTGFEAARPRAEAVLLVQRYFAEGGLEAFFFR
jgi:hypothetical protein